MSINLKRICVPIDFSGESRHALLYGRSLAKQFGSELHVLHVIQDLLPIVPEPGIAMLPTEEILQSLEDGAEKGIDLFAPESEDQGLKVYRELRHGNPSVEILQYAKDEEIDLIIMGRHGRSAFVHFLMGSVAEKVVRQSPCPVLTVRSPEHDFVTEDS